ncbi:restriction endonuclease [Streptomyces sp. AD681]|uniref:restriction endonuclease n=1 Tax=Streptomyces sp. AD681 TaxID=3019069 RepID=UPI0022F1C0E0|nr:restriction endonuclease [Streptomyces sp. AD681]MDA5147516.1 restriction endonuclease [Streptomyces sp. AD681]
MDALRTVGARENGTAAVAVAVTGDHGEAGPRNGAIGLSCPDAGLSREALGQLLRMAVTNEDHGQAAFDPVFLVACLRLGSRVTLRTARRHDPAWSVVTIDVNSLLADPSWQVPVRSEPKTQAGQQGIEIAIEALRSPWPRNRQERMRRRLGDVYSYALRDQRLYLTVSGTAVSPRTPCVWGAGRLVRRRGQEVSAVQEIDMVLATLYQCQECRHTSPLGSSHCPQCGQTRLERIEHRVWGWLGIQRYLHVSDYGIDFYRQGRKILTRDKRLFAFSEDPEHPVVEYPADWPAKGRFVGEVHCDHVPVNFARTAFDFDSPQWHAVVHAVRGQGPLAPRRAQMLGYESNTSPLATLFNAFRRNDPGLRCLIPGDGFRALHEEAAAWGRRFRQGDPAYQSDEAWYEAALAHDTPAPAVTAQADDRTDLVGLSANDFDDLVYRLLTEVHGGPEGPRQLFGPGGAATVFRDRPPAGARWLVQTRRGQHVVPEEAVQALAGQMLDVEAARGILITTSWFSASSRAFAARSGRIDLLDGRALQLLLREYLGIDSHLRLRRRPPEWDIEDGP